MQLISGVARLEDTDTVEVGNALGFGRATAIGLGDTDGSDESDTTKTCPSVSATNASPPRCVISYAKGTGLCKGEVENDCICVV